MRYAAVLSGTGLAVWYAEQPDCAIYAFAVLARAGLRAIFDAIEIRRRR